MPESAHSSLQPHESDFNDSQPAEDKSPSLGDLSSVESEIISPKSSPSLQLGDLDEVESENQDAEHNDVLGDITLLEEAFAELEDGGKSSAVNDAEIPVLSESVDPPTSLSESQLDSLEEKLSESIPLLDQQATAYEEMNRQAEAEEQSISSTPAPDDPIPDNSIADSSTIDALKTTFDEEAPQSKQVTVGSAPTTESSPSELADDIFSAELNELSDEEVVSSLASQMDTSAFQQSEMKNSPSEPAPNSETEPPIESEDVDEKNEANPISQPVEPDTIDSVIDSAILQHESAMTTEENAESIEPPLDASTPASEMPSLTDEDLSMAYEQSLSRFAEDLENGEPSLDELELDSENSSPELMDSDFSLPETNSIDAKIAHATGNTGFEVNEIPITKSSEIDELPAQIQLSQFPDESSVSSFAEDLMMTEIPEMESEVALHTLAESELELEQDSIPQSEMTLESAPSELLIAETETDIPPTHAEHSVAIGNETGDKANFSLNIPFELHSQLSQKIDELVIEATTSLTNELQYQLAERMETLLNNSVESVLPRLIDQMASELRNEVKSQVKTQLPNIINDVLSKTRLNK